METLININNFDDENDRVLLRVCLTLRTAHRNPNSQFGDIHRTWFWSNPCAAEASVQAQPSPKICGKAQRRLAVSTGSTVFVRGCRGPDCWSFAFDCSGMFLLEASSLSSERTLPAAGLLIQLLCLQETYYARARALDVPSSDNTHISPEKKQRSDTSMLIRRSSSYSNYVWIFFVIAMPNSSSSL